MLNLKVKSWWAGVFLFGAISAQAGKPLYPGKDDFRMEADLLRLRIVGRIYENLNHPDVARGAVIASPSKSEPNYFSHWIRDAALAMGALVGEIPTTREFGDYQELVGYLKSWVQFEKRLQDVENKSGGLGEPRFNVDGTAYLGDWGRPQNDGPAARAITLIRFADHLLRVGEEQYVRREMYCGGLPPCGVVKRDLEYVAHRWRDADIDLWEEVRGEHFYTRALQAKALWEGSKFAQKMGDDGAARFYREQSLLARASLEEFVKDSRIQATIRRVGGWDHKTSGLDVAVILGALHSEIEGIAAFSVLDLRVLATAEALEAEFKKVYPINQESAQFEKDLGAAIGRYPEDVYNGNGFSQGGAWFVSTHAYAELYCRAGQKEKGLSYLKRSLRHVVAGSHMAEQFNRNDGSPQGARDLTWSYASYLTAYRACFPE